MDGVIVVQFNLIKQFGVGEKMTMVNWVQIPLLKKKMKVNPFLLKCCLYPMLPLFVVGLTILVFYKILPYYVLEILILDKWEAELIPRLLNLLLSILPLLLAFHKFHVAIKQLVL